MTKNKPLFIELLCLCDFAMTSSDNKLSLIGIFDRIFTRNLPTRYPRFFTAAVIVGPANTDMPINFQILSPSGKNLLPENQTTIKFSQNGKVNFVSDIANLDFSELGEYKLNLSSANKTLFSKSFYLSQITTPQSLPN